MPSRIRNALVVAAAVMSIGCSVFDPLVCTTEARPAITVEVLDSVTSVPVGEGATITATNGSSLYSAITYEDYAGPYQLAHEKAGEFRVTVEKSGYASWSRDGVRVTRGECHVHTVQLTALLQPTG
jgi:hypothetical protein